VDLQVEQAKAVAAANLKVNFFAYAMAAHLTYVMAAVQHWHFPLAC
jgi:hypothetical protein